LIFINRAYGVDGAGILLSGDFTQPEDA